VSHIGRLRPEARGRRERLGGVDVGELIAAGLYDPDDPDAAGRLELLEYLVGLGCTSEEMTAANDRGRLFALSGDRVVIPGRDELSLRDLGDRTGADIETVCRIWRALGFVDPGPDDGVASEADLVAIQTTLDLATAMGLPAALGVCRVIAASLARISDAISSAVRGQLPDLALEVAGSELATALAFGAVASFVPRTGQALDALFRHHLETARMNWERTESGDLAASGGVRLGVGFADLSGFTGITEGLTLAELSSLLTVFEEVADDIVREHHGRVVKYIGDAVMYVAPDPAAAVRIAQSLVGAAQLRGMQARGGVTAGVVLSLEGDFFGPVVNLAARLVAMAEPGDVLVTAEVVERLGGAVPVVPLGAREVRGFTQPIEVARLAITSELSTG
jgi:class 3 adenylate cyclase